MQSDISGDLNDLNVISPSIFFDHGSSWNSPQRCLHCSLGTSTCGPCRPFGTSEDQLDPYAFIDYHDYCRLVDIFIRLWWLSSYIIIISSLYHHYIIIISSLYHHYIIIISSLYHHYIIIISSLYHHYKPSYTLQYSFADPGDQQGLDDVLEALEAEERRLEMVEERCHSGFPRFSKDVPIIFRFLPHFLWHFTGIFLHWFPKPLKGPCFVTLNSFKIPSLYLPSLWAIVVRIFLKAVVKMLLGKT